MKRIFVAGACLAALMVPTSAFCQSTSADERPVAPVQEGHREDDPKLLDTIVVSGRVAGPGLWQVYKDDSHELWIMGTLSPLPAGIEWDATTVRELVSEADEIIWAPGYSVNVKANLFQQAMLGIGYLRAQKNPEGKSLREVLSPALHARWTTLKSRYMPRDTGVERKRPLVAADELLDAAVRSARLSRKPIVYPALKPTIETRGIRSTRPRFEVNLSSDKAKAALADVRRASLDDAKCLEATLDAVEHDIPRMVANANAWASGQVDRISFAALARRDALCSDALMDPGFSEKYGLPNIQQSVATLWLQKVHVALSSNARTVAIVPMEQLVGPGNYLDALRGLGYTVIAP